MVLYEVAFQDQVAVDLDDVVARAGGNGLVADRGDAESPVLVPDVAHRNGRDPFEMPHDVAGGHTRSVVGDEDFVGQHGLLHHTVETQIEGAGPIVGGNKQGYGHRTRKIDGVFETVWLVTLVAGHVCVRLYGCMRDSDSFRKCSVLSISVKFFSYYYNKSSLQILRPCS